MDAIKVFDYEVDISNCRKLYDYGRAIYIERPSGGWDANSVADAFVKSTSAPSPDNKRTKEWVEKVDRSFYMDVGWLKKTFKNHIERSTEQFASEDNVTCLPFRLLPVFKPGDAVIGRLVLELTEDMQAEEVLMGFIGEASTNTRLHNQYGYHDNLGSQVYVKEEIAVWRKGEEKTLLSSLPITTDIIPAGLYKVPFSFQIPTDAALSVPPLPLPSGHQYADWATIVYCIKATIKSGKAFKRGNILASRGVWVEPMPETMIMSKASDEKDQADLKEVIQEQVFQTGVLCHGIISCKAKLDKQTFPRGSDKWISLQLQIDNQSADQLIGVSANIQMHGYYRQNTGSWHGDNVIHAKGIEVMGDVEEVRRRGCSWVNLLLPLQFTEGIDANVIPVGTLEECEIIDVRYEVHIELRRKGITRKKLRMRIPIRISLP